jgi:hypothetical protein
VGGCVGHTPQWHVNGGREEERDPRINQKGGSQLNVIPSLRERMCELRSDTG